MAKSKGLGDTIEKFTKATGIKKVVESIWDSCGCDKRKEQLNKLFPSKNQVECLEQEEYEYLKEFFKDYNGSVSYQEQERIVEINNRILHERREVSSCGSCAGEIINNLKKAYLQYEEKGEDPKPKSKSKQSKVNKGSKI